MKTVRTYKIDGREYIVKRHRDGVYCVADISPGVNPCTPSWIGTFTKRANGLYRLDDATEGSCRRIGGLVRYLAEVPDPDANAKVEALP